ncbi:MAG: DUF421 domain-containing protein [Clostridiales bacterium]|nr:DUF421 domain-containing protein [Clostridiales bacterium]
MDFIVLCLTSIFSYLTLFIMTKLIGYKQISQLDAFDYITGITIGSIAAEFATDLEAPWKPFLAMVLYATATILLSIITRKFPKTRKYLNGSSVIIMDNGKLYQENLKKAKLDLNEFLMMCREQGYFDLCSIQTALFESNGKITILPSSQKRPATPADLQLSPRQELLFFEIIMDGIIIEKNLQNLGLDQNWLKKQLKEHHIRSEKEVFLALCGKNQNIAFYKRQ